MTSKEEDKVVYILKIIVVAIIFVVCIAANGYLDHLDRVMQIAK